MIFRKTYNNSNGVHVRPTHIGSWYDVSITYKTIVLCCFGYVPIKYPIIAMGSTKYREGRRIVKHMIFAKPKIKQATCLQLATEFSII